MPDAGKMRTDEIITIFKHICTKTVHKLNNKEDISETNNRRVKR